MLKGFIPNHECPNPRAKVPEAGTLGKTKNNTNNFPENSRKMHKVNSLV